MSHIHESRCRTCILAVNSFYAEIGEWTHGKSLPEAYQCHRYTYCGQVRTIVLDCCKPHEADNEQCKSDKQDRNITVPLHQSWHRQGSAKRGYRHGQERTARLQGCEAKTALQKHGYGKVVSHQSSYQHQARHIAIASVA